MIWQLFHLNVEITAINMRPISLHAPMAFCYSDQIFSLGTYRLNCFPQVVIDPGKNDKLLKLKIEQPYSLVTDNKSGTFFLVSL